VVILDRQLDGVKMSESNEEKVGRFRVRGKGFLIDSGILADSGAFIDSPDARRIPILLLDWPIEMPPRMRKTLEMMASRVSVSIRSTDDDGDRAATILFENRPYPVRRIGIDAETGLPLYEHVICHFEISAPEYAKVEEKYDRNLGEVNQSAFLEGQVLRSHG
jgi:hypothetical protein